MLNRIIKIVVSVAIASLICICSFQYKEINKLKNSRDIWSEMYWNTEMLRIQVEDELWDLKSISIIK